MFRYSRHIYVSIHKMLSFIGIFILKIVLCLTFQSTIGAWYPTYSFRRLERCFQIISYIFTKLLVKYTHDHVISDFSGFIHMILPLYIFCIELWCTEININRSGSSKFSCLGTPSCRNVFMLIIDIIFTIVILELHPLSDCIWRF